MKRWKTKGKKTLKVSKATKAYVKKAIAEAPEEKYCYVPNPSWDGYIGTSPGIYPLQSIVPGNSAYNRLGDKIKAKELDLRIMLKPGANSDRGSGLAFYGAIRIIIFSDKTFVGAVATYPSTAALIARLLKDDSGDDKAVVSPYEEATIDQFRILWDKTYGFNTGTNPVCIHKKINLRNTVCEFQDDTFAMPGKGNLGMLIVSNVNSTDPAFSYNGTFRFTDA